jgi:type IV pilus assembly protein PilM
MPAVGLDISDNAISAVELVRRGDAYAVGRFGRRPLPSGAIVGGYINDKDSVVAELQKLRTELSLGFVNASLSEEKAYLFKTSIPIVPHEEIRGVLEFKLEENVPIPAVDAIFDYTVIREGERTHKDHLDVSVTVLPKKVVETYAGLIVSAGLTPLSFETEAQAVSRAVLPKGDHSACLIVHFGETKTGLFIVSDEVVHFTSTVAIGGANITGAIAKYLSVSTEEAERIKRERAQLADRKNMDLFFSLMNAISALKDEINKLSTYWNTHKEPAMSSEERTVKRIILTGRDAGLAGFDDYLSLTLRIPVIVGNVWSNTCTFENYIPPIGSSDALEYAAAIGLALPKSH